MGNNNRQKHFDICIEHYLNKRSPRCVHPDSWDPCYYRPLDPMESYSNSTMSCLALIMTCEFFEIPGMKDSPLKHISWFDFLEDNRKSIEEMGEAMNILFDKDFILKDLYFYYDLECVHDGNQVDDWLPYIDWDLVDDEYEALSERFSLFAQKYNLKVKR